MKKPRIVRFDPRIHKDQTDWARVRAMTDEEIEAAIADDPDASPIWTDEDWRRAVWVQFIPKVLVSIRLDADIVRWFKARGPRYQTRINRVLRAFMDAQRGHETKALRDLRALAPKPRAKPKAAKRAQRSRTTAARA